MEKRRASAIGSLSVSSLLALMAACAPIINPIQEDIAQKTNADLAALSISVGTLSPAFASSTLSYDVVLGSGVESATVTATKSGSGAKIEMRRADAGWGELPSGSASSALALAYGDNLIELRVTAEDAKTTKTYSVYITRLDVAARLSSLVLSAGTLSPAFDKDSAGYSATVPNAVDSIIVTAVLAQSAAAIDVRVHGGDWQPTADGSASPSLPLEMGDNRVDVRVTADDGQTTNTYAIAVHRIGNNAELAALTSGAGSLIPAFSPNIPGYAITVGTPSLSLRPTAADSYASIKARANGGAWLAVGSGSDSGALDLAAGANTIELLVTADDGVTTKTYSVSVWRQSDNADLGALTISAGSLTPAFAASTAAYSVIVANGVAAVSVTPTAAESHAGIQARMGAGTWQALTSGSASGAFSLNVGDNSLEVKVTAENGGTKSYVIGVHGISSSADLAALSLSSGILAPAFSSATLTYGTSVGNEVGSVLLTPSAATAVSNIQVRVNGGAWRTIVPGSASLGLALDVGDNSLEVKVVSENGLVTKVYSVMVHRISANASLVGLAPSAGSLSPSFITGTLSYSLNVIVNSIAVLPTASDSRATIRAKVNSGGWQTVVSGSNTTALALDAGNNAIVVEVTAEDGITKSSYTLTVYRKSNDARLASLSLGVVSLAPAFSGTTMSYTASVSNAVTSLSLTPTAAESHATIQANTNGGSWQSIPSGQASTALALNVGDNTIHVKAEAEDGVTDGTYTVTVHRKSADATLGALTPSAGSLSPAFAAGTTAYSATVGSAVGSVAFTATAASSMAVLQVKMGTGEWLACASGSLSPALSLDMGDNAVTLRVTAEDGSPQAFYLVTVHRLSGDANLSGLAISAGNLSPGFSSLTTSYSDKVAEATTTVTLTPVAEASTSIIEVQVNGGGWGSAVSGSPTAALALNHGANTVEIKVTAEETSFTKTYAISLIRRDIGGLDYGFASGTGANSSIYAMAVQGDGKIVIGGHFTAVDGTTNRNYLTRLNADGCLDTSFYYGASPFWGFSNGGGDVWAVAVQGDGKILAGGNFGSFYNGTNNSSPRIIRLTSTGNIDSTFSVGTGADAQVSSIVIEGDGKILIGGTFSAYNGVAYRVCLARLNANGSADDTLFAVNGFDNGVATISLDGAGNILAGGYFLNYALASRRYILRLVPTAYGYANASNLDTSFATTGVGLDGYALAIKPLGGGKILVGGSIFSYNGDTNYRRILRLNSDGSLDTTFNTTGTGLISGEVDAIAVQADGKIIIAGSFTSYNGIARGGIARLNSDGSLDATFLATGSGANGAIRSIYVQSDGKIVISGVFTSFNGTARGNIARVWGD